MPANSKDSRYTTDYQVALQNVETGEIQGLNLPPGSGVGSKSDIGEVDGRTTINTVHGQNIFNLVHTPDGDVTLHYNSAVYIENIHFTRLGSVVTWTGPFFFEVGDVVVFKYEH